MGYIKRNSNAKVTPERFCHASGMKLFACCISVCAQQIGIALLLVKACASTPIFLCDYMKQLIEIDTSARLYSLTSRCKTHRYVSLQGAVLLNIHITTHIYIFLRYLLCIIYTGPKLQAQVSSRCSFAKVGYVAKVDL